MDATQKDKNSATIIYQCISLKISICDKSNVNRNRKEKCDSA